MITPVRHYSARGHRPFQHFGFYFSKDKYINVLLLSWYSTYANIYGTMHIYGATVHPASPSTITPVRHHSTPDH